MSMIKYMVVLVLFLTGLVGCDRRKKVSYPKKEELVWPPTDPLQDKKLMYTLMDSALATGDERVYSKVSAYYIMGGNEQEFYYCAVTMANKYNSAMAYYHVFLIISVAGSGFPDPAFNNVDKKSKDFALYNLLRSYELGYEDARPSVEGIFGKKTTFPKSSTYLKKFCAD